MSAFYLGVDGGQSSTTAVIGDGEGRVVGWGSAGPCNHVSAGEARAKFLRVVGECIAEAASRAGLEPVQDGRWRFSAAYMGMSGGPDDKAALLAELIDSPELMVTHDAMVALAGATAGEPGVVVIAGTGSMAFGRNAAGETARAGGWGYIFGDEGGAFDIVRQAVRAALREHEGWGPRTVLTPALVAATSSAEPNQMLHLFYTPEWPRSRVAGLAPIVSRIAEEGDVVAQEVLHNSAQHLANLVSSVRRQLWNEAESLLVSWTGGVFSSLLLAQKFRDLLQEGGQITCVEPRHSAAIGALLLAWRTGKVVPVL